MSFPLLWIKRAYILLIIPVSFNNLPTFPIGWGQSQSPKTRGRYHKSLQFRFPGNKERWRAWNLNQVGHTDMTRTPALLKLITVLCWAKPEPATKLVNVIRWLSGFKILLFCSFWDFCSHSNLEIWKTAMPFTLITTFVNSLLFKSSAQVIIISVLDFSF